MIWSGWSGLLSLAACPVTCSFRCFTSICRALIWNWFSPSRFKHSFNCCSNTSALFFASLNFTYYISQGRVITNRTSVCLDVSPSLNREGRDLLERFLWSLAKARVRRGRMSRKYMNFLIYCIWPWPIKALFGIIIIAKCRMRPL